MSQLKGEVGDRLYLELDVKESILLLDGKDSCLACEKWETCDHVWEMIKECWVPCG